MKEEREDNGASHGIDRGSRDSVKHYQERMLCCLSVAWQADVLVMIYIFFVKYRLIRPLVGEQVPVGWGKRSTNTHASSK